MIIRKPYAFLIKNFKKIHIALLVCVVFMYFKLLNVLSFLKGFITYETYNSSLESFDSQVGVLFYLALAFVVIVSIALMVLLIKKKKPWKIYIVYLVVFLIIFAGIRGASSYFAKYTAITELSGILGYRDLINMGHFLLYPIMFLLIIRILGIDIKKFGFEKDQEFLELSEEDRAEFEVNFQFDKRSIRRVFNRTIRNIKYFYLEHKLICNTFITVLIVIISVNITRYAISHRSYKQGQNFNAGNYNIRVNDAFVTDKDYAGNKIENGYKFVIVDVDIQNRRNVAIEPNFDRFHLINKNYEKIYTIYYNSYFDDFGKGADSNTSIDVGKSKNVYLIFKVKDNLRNSRFVLYYQEIGILTILRKIKINVNDISNIKDMGTYSVNNPITFKYTDGSEKKINIINNEISDTFTYKRYYCSMADVCGINDVVLKRNKGKILKISFTSSDFEGEDFIDFLVRYGKIRYRVGKSKNYKYDSVANAVSTNSDGKESFIKLTDKEAESNDLDIVCTLRNKRYIISIK